MACNCSKRVRGGDKPTGLLHALTVFCWVPLPEGCLSRIPNVSWLCFGVAVSFAVRMLSVRPVWCYPDHVELAGTPSGRVVLGPTETLIWDC
jgi:hypothetical protein